MSNKVFGLPYMGSKSSIAQWVISKLPPADNFIEPFAGGCAVTHAAILSGKYKRIIINDITDSTQVFIDAIHGKFKDEKRWISREDFMKLKEKDSYARICFSFGNDQRTYCYSKDIELYKRAFHYAVVFQDTNPFADLGIRIPQFVVKSDNQIARRMAVKRYLIWLRKDKHAGDLQNLERLESLQNLESLERLKRLQNLERLQSLERLENYQGDYRNVPIPKEGTNIIYCDPPYRGTAGYLNSFDSDEFDDWCRAHKGNIFISEYSMPKDFKMISAIAKRSLLSSNGSGKIKTEGLWVHESVYSKYR